MGDVYMKVETMARLAQVRIDSLATCSYRKSDPFKIGPWNWHLLIEKGRALSVRLFIEPSRLAREQPPIATFVIRILPSTGTRRSLTSPVFEKLMRNDEFAWTIDTALHGKFIIEVEFHDLKIIGSGGEPVSIWSTEVSLQNQAQKGIAKCLSRMLEDSIHTDVTIRTEDGVIGAHRAILASRSPVFERMFQHDLKEKLSSSIHIQDMSEEACRSLLAYLYGTITYEDFQKHRVALMRASDKYDIQDLKEACEDSLLEDISIKNVLQRLQDAWLYQLQRLKRGCLKYLLDFGKVYELREEMTEFLLEADKELIVEMFEEGLNLWKG
ncbi:hypothetical protein R1sor_020992 [Riccia sorocarpa]|uniref:BTB domain-containing protein n=1 Tax=Riccia sorocarpa TaxID=122646 RepID=A0ABD3GH89_9MARC